MPATTVRVLVRAFALAFTAAFLLHVTRRMTSATSRRRSRVWRGVDTVIEGASNLHAPCNLFSGNRHFATFPAVSDDVHDPHLETCDLSQGLDMGHRCDVKRGYTFFTFDPLKDTRVSAGMMATGGLYDSHVHAALDATLKTLKDQRGITCDHLASNQADDHVVLDVGSDLGSLALYAASLGCPTQAFEIQPAVACRLEMSIKASDLDIILHRKAVHSEAGKRLKFPNRHAIAPADAAAGAAATDSHLTLTTVRLDDMFFESKGDVLFMKVEMGDNELEVLKSADKLLTAKRIHGVVCEVRHDELETVKYMYARGYTCALIKDEPTRAPLSCRGRNLEQISADIQGIPGDGFSDVFCCVA